MRSAVILAGGQSTRMEFDKRTALFHKKPLIYWSYNALADIADEVILSLSIDGDADLYQKLLEGEFNIARDEKPGMGPICGMLSSFNIANGEYVAVAPCDTPFIRAELYLKLFEIVKDHDGAVPFINGYWEPLHGVYKRNAMIKAMGKTLAEGDMRITDTYKYLDIKELTEDDIRDFDSRLASFVNINSLEDLTDASSLFFDLGMQEER